MTRDQIRDAVLKAVGEIAPETDPTTIEPEVPLREQLDIDSMDFLRFVLGLHESLGVDVPEKNYPRLITVSSCVDYLTTATRSPLEKVDPGAKNTKRDSR